MAAPKGTSKDKPVTKGEIPDKAKLADLADNWAATSTKARGEGYIDAIGEKAAAR